MKRLNGSGTVLLLASFVSQAGAQELYKETKEYSGYISWINTSTDADGTAREMVTARVIKGVVQCTGSWSTPGRPTVPIDGPGLLNITFGLSPETATAQNANLKGKMYSFVVACPNAQYEPMRPAKWSDGMNSWRQPGGDVDLQTGKLILPDVLKGSWVEKDPSGASSVSLSWSLCRGCSTPPEPPPSPPPAG